jgi:hypothetical protein
VQNKDEIIISERENSKRLNSELEELKKRPNRTQFQESEYQRIKGLLSNYNEDCKTVLRHLMRHGKMGKYQGGALGNLPDGLDRKRAENALEKLLEDHLVTQEPITEGNMRRLEWTIAVGVKSALEELLQ